MVHARPEEKPRIGPTLISAVLLLVALMAMAQLVVARFATRIVAERSSEEWVEESARIGWSPASESEHLAFDLFQRINDERTARGLATLVWDEQLADLSRRWSEEMISTGFEHSPGSFRTHPGFRGIGENVAMGHANTSRMHVDWMESDGHRVNILEPGFTAIGVGLVCRSDGLMWATQMFGSPSGEVTISEANMPPVEPIVRGDSGLRC